MVPTIEELRNQCRIDSYDATEDQALTLYCSAAKGRAENYINRKLYDDKVPENESEGLVISSDIKLALMLAVGFWYENREAQSLPAGFFPFWNPTGLFRYEYRENAPPRHHPELHHNP